MLPLAALLAVAPAAVEGELLGYWESRFYGMWGQGDELELLAPLLARRGIDVDEHWAMIHRLRPTAKLHLTDDSTLVATAHAEAREGFFTDDPDDVADLAGIERLYLTLSRGAVDLV